MKTPRQRKPSPLREYREEHNGPFDYVGGQVVLGMVIVAIAVVVAGVRWLFFDK